MKRRRPDILVPTTWSPPSAKTFRCRISCCWMVEGFNWPTGAPGHSEAQGAASPGDVGDRRMRWGACESRSRNTEGKALGRSGPTASTSISLVGNWMVGVRCRLCGWELGADGTGWQRDCQEARWTQPCAVTCTVLRVPLRPHGGAFPAKSIPVTWRCQFSARQELTTAAAEFRQSSQQEQKEMQDAYDRSSGASDVFHGFVLSFNVFHSPGTPWYGIYAYMRNHAYIYICIPCLNPTLPN